MPAAQRWCEVVVRKDAHAILSVVGAQVWLTERGREGRVHAEVVLGLAADGRATVKPWGLDSTLHVVRADDVTGVGVVNATRDQFLRAAHENARLAAQGRFTCPA